MFEIKKGVPLPANAVEVIYNFAGMDVGDCFFAPDDQGKTKIGASKRQNTISGCVRAYVKRHNPSAKFTTRSIGDGTIGCWRIA
jgi:hypothetical protein